MQALDMANEIRLHVAAIKQQIKTGELSIADALTDPVLNRENNAGGGPITVGQLLMAQDQWGRFRMRTLLGRVGNLSENRPICRLTQRQRGQLVEALGE
jgi:hypothetical protein